MKRAQVIGGGIVGLSCALALQFRGWSVELFEQNPAGQPASFGNAGHLATEQVVPLASWPTLLALPRRLFLAGGPVGLPPGQIAYWLPFGLRMASVAGGRSVAHGTSTLSRLLAEALAAWTRLLAETDATDLLRADGHCVAWTNARAALRGRAAWQSAPTGTATARALSPGQWHDLRTVVEDRVSDALWFDGTGSIVSPGAALAALRSGFLDRGGTLVRQRHTLKDALRDTSILTVVAAGHASAALMAEIGCPTPMIAERGYHVEGEFAGWPEGLPTVVLEDLSIVLAPMGKRLRLTGFVEFGGPHARPDPRKWAHLEKAAQRLGLRLTDISRWVGIRPTLPDYLPAIGRVPGHPNLIAAYGHQHLGLTLGPLTGELVAQIADDGPPAIDCRPFAPNRFRR